MATGTRRKFTAEFKREAMRLAAQPGRSVSAVARELGVARSGFYEWLGRPPSARSVANASLLVRIRESFALSGQTYGSPRVWKDMVVAGERCSENRIARLMRVARISGQAKPRRKPSDADVRPENRIAPNVLERDFTASAPNRKLE